MGIEFSGDWIHVAHHQTPLLPLTGVTVGCFVEYFLGRNISAHKVILGITFVGKTFELTDPKVGGSGFEAPTVKGKGLQGAFNKDDKVLNYNEICSYLHNSTAGWTAYEDKKAGAPFMKDTLGNWVSFEDTKSVRAKVEFGEEHRLGGYAAWSITNDDFKGNLCGRGINYPLLRTINYVLSKRANPSEVNPTATDTSEFDTTTIPPALSTSPKSTIRKTTEKPTSQTSSLETTSQSITSTSSLSPPQTTAEVPTSQTVSLETTSQPITSTSSPSTPQTTFPKPIKQNTSFDSNESQPTLPPSTNVSEGTETNGTGGGSSVVIYVVVTVLGVILLLVVAFFLGGIVRGKKEGNENGLSASEIRQFKKGRSSGETLLEQMTVEDNVNGNPYDKCLELPPAEYQIYEGDILGIGAYGIVVKGKVRNEDVAVKTVKPMSSKECVLSLLEEIKVLTYLGHHENIMGLIGANTASLPQGIVYVFVELCPLGSLEKYLTANRQSFVDLMKNDEFTRDISPLKEDSERMSSLTLLIWATQISNAMQFLASKNIIHGDLATRNVLLRSKHTVKVSDFGLSRKLNEYGDYIRKKQEGLPWRHMALEALRNLEFSTKSDVWAFGVTLWEIFTLGDIPYPGMSFTLGFVEELLGGLRMPKPRHATTELYEKTMLPTWSANRKDRPTFEELYSFLQDAVERVSFQHEYLCVNDFTT